jgi:hypothetical protein
MHTNPLVAFEDWLTSLPPKHKEEILLLTAVYFPGVDILPIPDSDADAKFMEYIKAQSVCPMKSIGTSIALDQIIEFVVMKDRGKKEDVQRQAENLAFLQERMRVELGENAAEKIEKMRREHPFRAAQWGNTVASWQEFRNAHFNVASYEATMRDG